MEDNTQPNRRGLLLFIITTLLIITAGAGAYWFFVVQETEPPPTGGGSGTLPPPTEDKEAPSIPSSVVVKAVSATQIDLSWDPSTDDSAVVGYRVYRDGKLVGSNAHTSFSDTTVQPATTYTYVITAYDSARHESLASNDVRVTTPEKPAANEPSGSTSTITIRTANNQPIQVKNFYADALEVTKGDVFIKDTKHYTLIYFPDEQAFLATINSSNVSTARAVLETDLPEILGVPKTDICKLSFSITVPHDVNEAYLKETIILSFCPGGTPL